MSSLEAKGTLAMIPESLQTDVNKSTVVPSTTHIIILSLGSKLVCLTANVVKLLDAMNTQAFARGLYAAHQRCSFAVLCVSQNPFRAETPLLFACALSCTLSAWELGLNCSSGSCFTFLNWTAGAA